MLGCLIDGVTNWRLGRKARVRARNARVQVERGAAILDLYFKYSRAVLSNWHNRVDIGILKTRRYEQSGILVQLFPEPGHNEALAMLRRIDSRVGFGSQHGFARCNENGDPWSEEPTPEEVDLEWAFLVLQRQKKNKVVLLHSDRAA